MTTAMAILLRQLRRHLLGAVKAIERAFREQGISLDE